MDPTDFQNTFDKYNVFETAHNVVVCAIKKPFGCYSGREDSSLCVNYSILFSMLADDSRIYSE